MTIAPLLIFFILAVGVRWLLRGAWRGRGLLLISALAVFWIQPGNPLRNLDFWLPCATIAFVVLGWAITAPAAAPERSWRANISSFIILLGVILLMGGLRFLDLPVWLVFPAAPPPTWVLAGLCAAAGAIFLGGWLARSPAIQRRLLWVWFFWLLLCLVALKTAPLQAAVSGLWRGFMGQDVTLAQASDLQWLGFSYLAFRLIHTLRDRQAGRLPVLTLEEFTNYAIFFPSFTAGPIARVENFVKDLRQTSLQTGPALDDLIEGSRRVLVGLVKKFVIADTLGLIALTTQNAYQVKPGGWIWVLVYAYTLQIYCDFGGYSDIAIGIGRVKIIRLPENFQKPYLRTNLTQFWNNWHMSLTQWFRSYYFNPLARALRMSHWKPDQRLVLFLCQVSTMVLIGLWHGVTWNFVLWGLWHGVGQFIQNRWSESRRGKPDPLQERPGWMKVRTAGEWLLTFNYVALGWVWFATDAPATAWVVFQRLAGF